MNELISPKGTFESPGVFKWANGDSPELFEKNKNNPKTLKKLEDGNWLEKDVEYHINQYLFRDTWEDENDFSPGNIMAIGCSVTAGLGLQTNETWPKQLSKMLDKDVYNFGMPGQSLEGIFRVFWSWINYVKPSCVCLVSPGLNRREIFDFYKQKFECFGSWSFDKKKKSKREKIEEMAMMQLLSKEECYISSLRTVNAIQNLCNLHQIELYYIYLGEHDNYENPTWARDLCHAGPVFQENVACEFSKRIKDNRELKIYDPIKDDPDVDIDELEE